MNRKIVAVTLITVAAITGAALAPTDSPDRTAGDGPDRRLGVLSFPNSGSSDAQGPFIQGVLLLHSFEFEDAALAFREAQEIDPDFALAYWGEAMTYNHPLWRQQDGEAALATLARYAPTAQERQAKGLHGSDASPVRCIPGRPRSPCLPRAFDPREHRW